MVGFSDAIDYTPFLNDPNSIGTGAAGGLQQRTNPGFSGRFEFGIFFCVENLPSVAVRIIHPNFILHRIAACGIHLVNQQQSALTKPLPYGQHFFRIIDLESQVVQYTLLFEGAHIERKMQRRFF